MRAISDGCDRADDIHALSAVSRHTPLGRGLFSSPRLLSRSNSNLSRGCVQRSITRYQPQTLLLLDTYSVGCTVPVMYTHARLTDKPAHLTFLPEQSATVAPQLYAKVAFWSCLTRRTATALALPAHLSSCIIATSFSYVKVGGQLGRGDYVGTGAPPRVSRTKHATLRQQASRAQLGHGDNVQLFSV